MDTGDAHPIVSADREQAIGGKIYTFEDGLALYGLKPSEIDIVIHTHLHTDHCENDHKCTNARFYVHFRELERIRDPHPLDFRYLEDYIEDAAEAGRIESIDSDREIVPGISVMHTPAHTDGGLSVAVETSAGKAFITGFCVVMENFYPPPEIRGMEMSVIPPGTHVNAYDAYDILEKVRETADILIPLHEPSFAGINSIPQ